MGSSSFRLRLLEFGLQARAAGRRRSAKGLRAGRNRAATRGGPYTITMPARPSRAPALERAAPKMTEAFVSDLQQRVASSRLA